MWHCALEIVIAIQLKKKKKEKERFKTFDTHPNWGMFVICFSFCVFLTFKIFIFRPFWHYRGREQRAVNDTQEMSRARLEPRPLRQSLSKCGSPALWMFWQQYFRHKDLNNLQGENWRQFWSAKNCSSRSGHLSLFQTFVHQGLLKC